MILAIYDGKCVICQSTCETIRALDWLNRIEFIDLHNGGDLARTYPELSHERLMSEIHVLDAQGKLYAGFSGMHRMLRELPLGLPIWLLLQLPGTEAIGKSLYRFIARRRYRINALLGNELPECAEGGCQLLR